MVEQTLFNFIPKNNYSSVDDRFIKHAYKNKNAMYKSALILDQGQLKDVKKYMSIDDAMVTANALYDLKQLPLEEKKEIINNFSVYEIITLAYNFRDPKSINPFAETKSKRPNGLKPTHLKSLVKKNRKLSDNQKTFYESDMIGQYDDFDLQSRLSNLTESEEKEFKKTFLQQPKEFASSIEYDMFGHGTNFFNEYVVANKTKKLLSHLIANSLNDSYTKPTKVPKRKSKEEKEYEEYLEIQKEELKRDCEKNLEEQMYETFNIPKDQREFVNPYDLHEQLMHN